MKKLVSLALSAVLALSVVACGSSDTAASTTESTSESSDATASADGAFKIGGIGPITGGAAIYGQAVMNAAQMATDEINAAGGINGYQVESMRSMHLAAFSSSSSLRMTSMMQRSLSMLITL